MSIDRLVKQIKSAPLIRPIWRRYRQIRFGPIKQQEFAIAQVAGWEPTSGTYCPAIDTPIITAAHVTDIDATFVADPFVLIREDKWYLYFEVLPTEDADRLRNGVVALATSSDRGSSWQYQQVVLREPFHLSYPLVFDWEGKTYMVPESHESNSVRLYEAVEFPLKWEHVGDLLVGNFTDATPFLWRDSWWMFAESVDYGPRALGSQSNSVLRLYFADDLRGPWVEHPLSPVITSNRQHARPAGRVVENKAGSLFRFAQDCSVHYGESVYAFEILELTRTTYLERILQESPILAGFGTGWNSDGMHHIDAQQCAEGWVVFVDGWRYSSK